MTTLALLPLPQHLQMRSGFFRGDGSIRVILDPQADSIAWAAAAKFGDAWRERGARLTLESRGLQPPPAARVVRLDLRTSGRGEGYRLVIGARRVDLLGDGQPGLFYGLQTLLQILRSAGALPCLEIEDEPALAHRGYYLDISRGRVPRRETLHALVDKLAALKVNHLQLYVEHVFHFPFDPAIAAGCDALNAEDVRDLDEYCRARHVALVPSLTCFGHMGRLLSLPAYRRLAEVPWPAKDWERADWLTRLRGATLNPRAAGSRGLVERLLDAYLPLFREPWFNMCGDETYDLGCGRNARRLPDGVGGLYLDHVRFVREVAARYGKRLMFWGDVMLHHPDQIPGIPRDCLVLDWGYAPQTPFAKTARFLEAGLDAWVCPSTRGYKTVFNEIEAARTNIAGYARSGVGLGAAGLLNTDWGDMGHFNMAACSLHGLALGAAMAWNPRMDEAAGFDHAFSLQVFGDSRGVVGRLFREAGATGLARWPLFAAVPPENPAWMPALTRRARRVADQAASWAEQFRALPARHLVRATDVEQLANACDFLRLNAATLLWLHSQGGRRSAGARLARELDAAVGEFARLWRQLNLPNGLRDIQRRAFDMARRRLTS